MQPAPLPLLSPSSPCWNPGSPPRPLPNCPFTRLNPHNTRAAARCSACCCKPTWDQRGDGDVGPALAVTGPAGVTQRYTHRRLSTRAITTIFGPVRIERLGYSQPGAPSVYPLDQALALPARSFSYELQRRLVRAAVLNPFQESVNTIAELTGITVPKRSVEEIVRDAARDFDAFYQQRPPAPDSGPILVAAIDCKGIPMVKPENNAPPAPRLTKGQKANRKRMATVATVFTRQPWMRTPAQVIESLFRSRSREESALLPTPPRPENKRVWASLTKGKTAVIDEVIAEMQRRDPGSSKTRLALTDGERGPCKPWSIKSSVLP